MPVNRAPKTVYRFGEFELNPMSGELQRNGDHLRLPEQPLHILLALLDRAGEIVSREEIRKRLWPDGTFVDFEHSLNAAMRRLREALEDSADEPHFIETIPRRGYRFIALVETDAVAGEHQEEQEGVPRGRGRAFAVAAAMGVLLIASATAYWYWAYRATRPAIPFEKRDWVLIGTFENRTGEADFNGVIEAALGMELSNSRHVNVAPRERVQDALRLMKRPLNAVIDIATGREICLRDGGIRAQVAGRVTKLGDRFLVTVELLNPVTGATVASRSEEAAGQRAAWPAIRRLSGWLREKLGEDLAEIQASEQQLEKVTTPSLPALRLYTAADWLIMEGQSAAAETLLAQAIAEDPEFASAYLLLAWCGNNQAKPFEQWVGNLQRAFELAKNMSERERLFIVASYHHMHAIQYSKGQAALSELQAAVEHYNALLRLYPDHFWATNNLNAMDIQVGRWSVPYSTRLADVRPHFPFLNYTAAVMVAWGVGFEAARPYYERVAGRMPVGWGGVISMQVPLGLYPAFQSWVEERPDQALATLKGVENEITRNPAEREAVQWALSLSYRALGRLGEAERHNKWYPLDLPISRAVQLSGSAGIAFDRGDFEAFASYARGFRGHQPNWPWAIQMARAGLLADAEKMARALRDHPSGINDLVKAEVAFAKGDCETGIGLSEGAIEPLRNTWYKEYFIASESLALALEERGQRRKAIGILEEASQERRNSFPDRASHWLRIRFWLWKILRKAGREGEARDVGAQLRRMLAVADSDYPILKALDTGGSLPIEIPAVRACAK